MNETKLVYLVEIRFRNPKPGPFANPNDHEMKSDVVTVQSSLELARQWIADVVKEEIFNKEAKDYEAWWFAICTEKLDLKASEFGHHATLLETYALNGENLNKHQPS